MAKAINRDPPDTSWPATVFPLPRRPSRIAGRARRPAAAVLAGFAVASALGTVGLMLPLASDTGSATGFVPAVFTAVSAVTVTGLIVVDTPTHWSVFGEVVIRALVQVAGSVSSPGRRCSGC
jgi:trk system potassium uptake protein